MAPLLASIQTKDESILELKEKHLRKLSRNRAYVASSVMAKAVKGPC